MNGNIFAGVFPTGISYADRAREVAGNYKRLAFLPFSTLKLEVDRDCPLELERDIRDDAKTIQKQVGEAYPVTSTGQTVLLGDKVKPVQLTLRGESVSSTWTIIAFSMLEPSVYRCAFRTTDGKTIYSEGRTIEYQGDIDALPPAH